MDCRIKEIPININRENKVDPNLISSCDRSLLTIRKMKNPEINKISIPMINEMDGFIIFILECKYMQSFDFLKMFFG